MKYAGIILLICGMICVFTGCDNQQAKQNQETQSTPVKTQTMEKKTEGDKNTETPEPKDAPGSAVKDPVETDTVDPKDILNKKPTDMLTKEDMKLFMVVLDTNFGEIKFRFYPDDAPETCRNFIKLARQGFYDGLIFHRIIKDFMIQGGCPLGTGTGDPGYKIKAEFNKNSHIPGAVSMARSKSPDSAGSQFFICHGKHSAFLDGKYTVFGQVLPETQSVVDKIANVETGANDRPVSEVKMNEVYLELLEK